MSLTKHTIKTGPYKGQTFPKIEKLSKRTKLRCTATIGGWIGKPFARPLPTCGERASVLIRDRCGCGAVAMNRARCDKHRES